MTTQRAAATLIRFQLEQLRARNSFHEFEHLCRQYARVRLDSSVLPATGPVAGGGDGGRDFESLLTFCGDDRLGRRQVFACTLQQRGLTAKVKRDLRTIASGGSVRVVYYFFSSDVTIGSRHKWQAWAQQTLGLQLDVIDGQALSEHLCAPDLVWIAEEYLAVPKEHLPRPDAPKTPYERLRTEWQDPARNIVSIGDFLEVRFGIRTTTREPVEAAEDAPKWLSLMRRFVDAAGSGVLWLQGAYEIVIGTFYSKNQLEACGSLIRSYLVTLTDGRGEDEPSRLRDCLTIANAALVAGDTGISADELAQVRNQIAEACERALLDEERPSSRCGYFEVQLLIALFEPKVQDSERLARAGAVLQQVLELAPTARFYDAHQLAQALALVVEYLDGSSEFRLLLARLDEVVASRFGGGIAASLCRDRALRLCKAGKILAAIREVHQAKAGWFTGESMVDCVRAFNLLSELYLGAGLPVAALHHAQAGLLIAGVQSSDLQFIAEISDLLRVVSRCRIYLGQTYEYLQTAEVALALDPSSATEELSLYMTLVAAIEVVEPRLGRAIRGRWQEHVLRNSFLAPSNMALALDSARELLDAGEFDRFTDCGRERSIEWLAFGSHWCVSCRNSPRDVEVAEEIAALLQVLQADMFDRDPWHHLGRIQIVVVSEPGAEPLYASCKSDSIEIRIGERWIPGCTDDQMMILAVVIDAVFIKRDMSAEMNAAMREGLLAKVFAGATYAILRSHSIFGRRPRLVRSKKLAAVVKRRPLAEETLKLPAPRAKGHSGPEWDHAIAHRYERWLAKLGPSLRELRKHRSVCNRVAEWRSKGIPEWHIVGALGSLLVHAAFKEEMGVEPSENLEQYRGFFESLPVSNRLYELPLEMLSDEYLERSREAYMAAFLTGQGVELRNWSPARFAVFADVRLGFNERGPSPPDWLGEVEQ